MSINSQEGAISPVIILVVVAIIILIGFFVLKGSNDSGQLETPSLSPSPEAASDSGLGGQLSIDNPTEDIPQSNPYEADSNPFDGESSTNPFDGGYENPFK